LHPILLSDLQGTFLSLREFL